MAPSEVAYSPSARLAVRGCRECPFARVAVGSSYCTGRYYLRGGGLVDFPESVSGNRFGPVPEAPPDGCPIRGGGVEIVLASGGA